MGNDSLPSRSNGQTILDTWFNVLRNILNGDYYPRVGGSIVDEGGSLGTSSYKWLNVYLKNIRIIANGFTASIYGSSSQSENFDWKLPAALPAAAALFRVNPSAGVGSISQEIVSAAPAKSSSSGSFTVTGSETDVTNLSLTIQGKGRPIRIEIMPDGNTSNAAIFTASALGGSGIVQCNVTYRLYRDATVIAIWGLHTKEGATAAGDFFVEVPGYFSFLDENADTSSRTYKVTAEKTNNAGATARIDYVKLVVSENGPGMNG